MAHCASPLLAARSTEVRKMSANEVLNGVGADIASDQFRRRGRGISGMADHTDAGPLFAAVHESVVGTFRTWRDVRLESVMRTKPDVRQRL